VGKESFRLKGNGTRGPVGLCFISSKDKLNLKISLRTTKPL
jgi:hypothetical protein